MTRHMHCAHIMDKVHLPLDVYWMLKLPVQVGHIRMLNGLRRGVLN